MHEIQHKMRIKKSAFHAETKIFVFRNLTEITDAYSHN